MLVIAALPYFSVKGQTAYEIRPLDIITDPYGYVAVTSDDTSSLAPAYVWVDKSSDPSTVHVTMSDDDIKGPFNIGFTFPFYWYEVDQFYIHSNGAIGFRSGNFWVPHDNNVPNPNQPNDLVVGLGADLNPECTGGDIYYWTNNTDSLVVTFENVATWWNNSSGCNGSHTFQIILTADGNITINYGPQTGGYDYGIGQTAISIGMESVLGNPGMSIYEDGTPASREPRDSFAIKIYRPDSSSFTVIDAAAGAIFPDRTSGLENSGVVIARDRETGFVPTAYVTNVGTDTLYNTQAVLTIRRKYSGIVQYSDTVVVPAIPPSSYASVSFANIDFSTFPEDYYTAYLHVRNMDDLNRTNDTAKIEIQMIDWAAEDTVAWVDLPAVMATPLSTRWLSAGGGWMVRFDFGYYPYRIDTAVLMMAGCSSTNPGCGPITAPVFLATEGSALGTVQDTIGSWTVTVNPDTAYVIPIPVGATVNGPVLLAFLQTDSLGPSVVVDTSKPFSLQTFESTNGITWGPYRDNRSTDFAFYIVGQSLQNTGVSENTARNSLLISRNGIITLGRVTDVSVYDRTGRRLFNGKVDRVILTDYPDGVYFIKVDGRVFKVLKR